MNQILQDIPKGQAARAGHWLVIAWCSPHTRALRAPRLESVEWVDDVVVIGPAVPRPEWLVAGWREAVAHYGNAAIVGDDCTGMTTREADDLARDPMKRRGVGVRWYEP